MLDRNQKFLALDLELNQPSGKIIQVGIAIGSINDTYDTMIKRKWYIDPGEPISEFIIQLTGITDLDIRGNCVSHETVARELSALIKEHNCFMNPVTWGGGDSTDLIAEFNKKCIDFPHFGRRWIDVKTWYTLMMLAKNKKPNGGLASAMGAFKLHFRDQAHRADIDAANTLVLFSKLIQRQRAFDNLLDNARTI